MADNTLNIAGLEKLVKALKRQPPRVRIGILGGKSLRSDPGKGGITNAEIGAAHEFGTDKLPVRSFLRLPLSALLEKELAQSGAFSKKALADVVAAGSLAPWSMKMAATAEGIVLGAFDTGGYGVWPPSDMSHKKNEQTLVETQQLRNSITTEVKE